MPAQGAVYIQQDKVDLAEVFEGVRSDKTLFRKASYYEVDLDGDTVRFNVMPRNEVAGHIRGFLGYIASLDQDEQRKRDTSHAVAHTQVVLGMVTDGEFEDNPAIWESLFRIATRYHGLVFVHGSVLLGGGNVLVGPLLDEAGQAEPQE